MPESQRDWHPGSFTKNFTWGPPENGLVELYNSIRVGFDNTFADVERDVFIKRIEVLERPFHIPANFFLFNEYRDGKNYLVADELVFRCIEFDHSSDFDKIALVAFLISLAGKWKGAFSYQRWPSLWAKFFVIDKVAERGWEGTNLSSDAIEQFLLNDRRYKGKTTRKLSTNLSYMLLSGGLPNFTGKRVEPWWVSSVFLVLDRVIRDRKIDGLSSSDGELQMLLTSSKFSAVSGPRSLEKDLAIPHIIELYKACGRERRFDPIFVKELIDQIQSSPNYLPNSDQPIGVAHPSNYRIRQFLPRVCAFLAMYAGFISFEIEETEELDTKGFVQRKLEETLSKLKQFGIKPAMTVSELMKITRDR